MALPTEAILERLPKEAVGWSLVERTIRRTFRFATFIEGAAFVKRLAEIAEAQAHHPEVIMRQNQVILTLTTHDEHGVTEKDLRLAGAANTTYDQAFKD